MTETVSRAAQGGLVALSLERLDDGRPLILADEANDKLGVGSYAATSDFPLPAVRDCSQVAAHLARRRKPALIGLRASQPRR